MTSIVDLSTSADRAHPGGVIGLAPGRSGACVKDWIALQTGEFRAGVQVVAIAPSAPYAARIRAALPGARIVLNHFHLLGPKALTRLATVFATDDTTNQVGAAQVRRAGLSGCELLTCAALPPRAALVQRPGTRRLSP